MEKEPNAVLFCVHSQLEKKYQIHFRSAKALLKSNKNTNNEMWSFLFVYIAHFRGYLLLSLFLCLSYETILES